MSPTLRSLTVLLAALSLAACSGTTTEKRPIPDAGSFEPIDAGPGDGGIPDAGEREDAGGPDDGGYRPLPLTITSIAPTRGPIQGGTVMQMVGKGFLREFAESASRAPSQSSLLIGGNAVTNFVVIGDTLAEFTAPPHAAGVVDVVLQNPNGRARCDRCITYFAPVLLQSVSPTTGPLAGGTLARLTGRGLTADAVVLFGDRTATFSAFDEASGVLSVVVPPGDEGGAVDVRVFNGVGTSSIRRGFRYLAPPQLESISPGGGPRQGGTVATLRGRSLSGVTACRFGTTPASDLNVLDDGALELRTPATFIEGTVDVTCSSPEGSSTLRGAWTFIDTSSGGRRLVGLSPRHASPAGGSTLRLFGRGLASTTQVTVGGAGARVVSATDGQVEVVLPPGVAHTRVDVVLGSGERLVGGFSWDPVLTAIRPSHGAQAGGTALEVDGEGFTGRLGLQLGNRDVAALTLASATRLTARSPAGVGGSVAVRVVDLDDPELFAELPRGFTYDEPLAIGAITPVRGAQAGGTFFTLHGRGFASGLEVRLGGIRAKDIAVLDSHTLTARSPASARPGAVDVTALLDDGQSASLTSAFTYFDPTSPGGGATGGPLDGTLNVTVLDATFTQYGAPVVGAKVVLGTDPSTPFQGTTDARGQVTFSDPALVKAQTVTVTKSGYELATVASQTSQNLTVYIGQNDGAGGGFGQGEGPSPASITGKVLGFKAPRVLLPGEREEVRVAVAPHSVFFTEPLGYTQPPLPAERTVMTRDGQSYSLIVYPGLYAVVATYGIAEPATGRFTPVLMGIARNVSVRSGVNRPDQDIVLDIQLDASAFATLDAIPLVPGLGVPAATTLWAYLDLGAEGVVPLGATSALTTTAVIRGLPPLDGSNFVFLVEAESRTTNQRSYFFRRQPGDLRQGLDLGPMLGLIELNDPNPATPVFNGSLSWTYGTGPAPDLTTVDIIKFTSTGAVTLWSVVTPGSTTQVSLPRTAIQALLDREPAGTFLQWQVVSSRSPRFDYDHWSYGDLGQLAWTSFTVAGGLLQLPPPIDGGTP